MHLHLYLLSVEGVIGNGVYFCSREEPLKLELAHECSFVLSKFSILPRTNSGFNYSFYCNRRETFLLSKKHWISSIKLCENTGHCNCKS